MVVNHRQFWHGSKHRSLIPAAISSIATVVGSANQGQTLPASAHPVIAESAFRRAGSRGQSASRSAFALIEVLMGSGILGVMSVTLYLAIAQGFAVMQVARENLRATQILQEKMETIRLYSWDQIKQPGFIPSTFTDFYDPSGSAANKGAVYLGTVIVTNAPASESYAADLKWVRVQVMWTSSNVRRQRSMQTFVSHYGLQNYVYPLK